MKAGGLLMVPILACSVIALAIVVERFWSLQGRRVLPPRLVRSVWEMARKDELDEKHLRDIARSSPLGRIVAAGLHNRFASRELMKEAVEDTGRHVAHDLERFLNTLGTIAVITPLLGLLGTVVGMIDVFNAITLSGVGSPTDLAGGISKALVTTASGISVAIPTLMFYRYFRGRVDELVIDMERESLKLIDVLQGAEQRL